MKKIKFTNNCKIDESWMSANEIDFRSRVDQKIREVVYKSDIFPGYNEIQVSYFQEGVGSIVAMINEEGGKIGVFKMIENKKKTLAEILSYKKYKEFGISSPTIYEIGLVYGYPYYIMEYFDTPTYRDLIDQGEANLEEVGAYLGKILFQFESIKGIGFGIPESDEGRTLRAEHIDLQNYLENEFNRQEYSDLNQEYLSIPNWKDLALEHIEKILEKLGNNSVLGNFDFGPQHFFTGTEPVLFDPDAEMVPDYFSAAFYCTPEMGYADWKLNLRKTVMSSYRNMKSEFDIELFTSALWLLTYRKCFRLLSLPSEKRVSRAVHMLGIIADSKKLELHVNDSLAI
jgi:hypothetical protein